MIKKIARVKNLNDRNLVLDDLKYWLGKPPEERVAAVDYIRRQFHGSTARLQRVARVIQRSQNVINKRASGRKKDLADLEALGEDY